MVDKVTKSDRTPRSADSRVKATRPKAQLNCPVVFAPKAL